MHRIRNPFLKLFCLAAAWTSPAAAQAPKHLDVFLLIGQSNMSGRGNMIAADTQSNIAATWLFKDSATWEPARNPLNRYSTLESGSAANQIGPGFGFAMEMHRLSPNAAFGLVVNARGGSSIASWLKGGSYYKDALTRARQAAKAGTLRAILWHQGESDAADPGYPDKLKGLMDSLRRDLGRPDLPVIAGQIGQFEPRHADFNARILTLPQKLAHCAVVKSDSLKDKGDKLHFDRDGQLVLGRRYAEQAWSLVYKSTGTVRPDALPSAGKLPASTGAVTPAWPTGTKDGGRADSMGRRVKSTAP